MMAVPRKRAALGRLTRVELRDAWSSESSDFAPWLAQPDNVALRNEAIGDLPMVPRLNVVSKPSDWSKTIRDNESATDPGLTELQLHLDLWTQFRRYLEDEGGSLRTSKPSPEHWSIAGVGHSCFGLAPRDGVRDNQSAVHLSIAGPDAEAHFHLLEQSHRERIEAWPELKLSEWMASASPQCTSYPAPSSRSSTPPSTCLRTPTTRRQLPGAPMGRRTTSCRGRPCACPGEGWIAQMLCLPR